MEIQNLNNIINKLKGSYKIKNPYFKYGKPIPFNVLGHSYSNDFPIRVSTIEYKGKQRIYVNGDYTIEGVQHVLKNLTINK